MDAIVLKATKYEDDGRILKIFTKEAGLVSVIVKKISKKGTYWQTLTSPLARGEFHLKQGNSALYTLSDASLTDPYLEIRENLDKLEAACTILRALLLSQHPEKASPALFHLTLVYLKKLKTFSTPALIALSFQMKLLNFEGLFPESKEELQETIGADEWVQLQCLCHTKTFDLLESISPSTLLKKTAESLFQSRIREYN